MDTLWIRGRRTTLGAVIGGVMGLGGGFFLGLLAQGIGGAESSDNVVLPVALAGGAAGALVGAVAGRHSGDGDGWSRGIEGLRD